MDAQPIHRPRCGPRLPALFAASWACRSLYRSSYCSGMTGAAVCRTGTLRAGLAGGRRRAASGVRRRCARGRPPWHCCVWGGSACAALCFYVCTDILFYFRCLLAFFAFVCLCAAVYGVIKKGWIIIVRAGGRHQKGDEGNCEKMCEEKCEMECDNRCEWL